MIVSWNWLKDYLDLDVDPAEVERRLMMAGLNHENTTPVGDDLAIDLEVTSNRPDCLGHIGVAREIAVLFDLPMTVPAAVLEERGDPVPAREDRPGDHPEQMRGEEGPEGNLQPRQVAQQRVGRPGQDAEQDQAAAEPTAFDDGLLVSHCKGRGGASLHPLYSQRFSRFPPVVESANML